MLKDWYGNIDENIPKHAQILICQRSNLVWDAELRTKFLYLNQKIAIFLFITLLGIGLFYGLTINNFFLLVLAPALPMILYLVRQVNENKEAIKDLSDLKSAINDTWDKLHERKKKDYYIEQVRTIQSKIFINRKNNHLIFDWFYNRYKNRQDEDMRYSTDQSIKDYKKNRS